MGGHLLRLGCGFSLFQRMMIWNKRIFPEHKNSQSPAGVVEVNLKSASKFISGDRDWAPINIRFQLVNWFRPVKFSQRTCCVTCEQYLDLETTWSSFMIG